MGQEALILQPALLPSGTPARVGLAKGTDEVSMMYVEEKPCDGLGTSGEPENSKESHREPDRGNLREGDMFGIGN